MLSFSRVNVEVLFMAFCKNCGVEIGEAKFCPSCGAAQEVTSAPVQDTFGESVSSEPIAPPVYSEPVSTPVYASPPSYSSNGDTSGMGSSQTPPVYTAPVYSPNSMEKPSTTGMMVFSIINIALGFLCCCSVFGLGSLILGIISLVNINKANSTSSTEEAQQLLKSAKTMNIIGAVCLGLALIISIIFYALNGLSYFTNRYYY